MKKVKKITSSVLITFVLCQVFYKVDAQNLQTIQFQGMEWFTSDPEAIVDDSQKQLTLASGIAFLTDLEIIEGAIEVEIAATGDRSFPGIIFHLHDDLHYEEVFIRSHKSGQPDALQYNPVFSQFANWQLYPEFQAAVSLKNEGWNILKVVFDRKQVDVYINDSNEPAIEIPQLRQDYPNSSKIGIRAHNGATFRNFRFTPLEDVISLEETFEYREPDAAIVMNWQVSPLFEGWPEEFNPKDLKWKSISADFEGLLDISKHVKKSVSDKFDRNPFEYVWLKLIIESDKETTKRLQFEFSDRILIVQNGKRVFEGGNSFRQKGPFFRGDFDKNLRTNTLFLPVLPGENIINVAVGAKANGWAVMARIEDEM
jgi:hypothetical protein